MSFISAPAQNVSIPMSPSFPSFSSSTTFFLPPPPPPMPTRMKSGNSLSADVIFLVKAENLIFARELIDSVFN